MIDLNKQITMRNDPLYLSKDLRKLFPNQKGFSRTNLFLYEKMV